MFSRSEPADRRLKGADFGVSRLGQSLLLSGEFSTVEVERCRTSQFEPLQVSSKFFRRLSQGDIARETNRDIREEIPILNGRHLFRISTRRDEVND